jgi:hypothetical protein
MSVAVLLLACSADPYPFPFSGPGASKFTPIAVAQPVEEVLVYVQVRPGDRIELVSAEPVGSLDGAAVKLWLSRPVVQQNGSLFIGDNLEEIPGAVITAISASPGPDNDVGIVGEMTASQPGVFTVTNVRMSYRLHSGDVQTRENIALLWTVCADDPAPADCPEASM